MKIGDIFDRNQPWMYPFTKVKKDTIEGWYIDWDKEPGYIPDIEYVTIGDLVSDATPNATPYWKVTGIIDGKIFLEPYGDNPFLTGIGAGGAILTERDWKVFSGEAEQEIIDRKLQRIQDGQFADYSDVSYITLGTQPFRFGPNGAEGGWYTATDWGTRGHRQGLSPQEIMMRDAETFQKLGLEVPPSALEGTLDPNLWTKLVSGTDELIPKLKLPSEDWGDPLTCARLVLTHPQPQIRKRNAKALISMADDDLGLRKTINHVWASLPPEGNVDKATRERIRHQIRDTVDLIRDEWQGDPEILELCHQVAEKLFNSQHPTYNPYEHFDAYWFTKESFIRLAERQCWIDILRLYSTAKDSTNRKYAVWGLTNCNDIEGLVEVVENDTHAEPLAAALRGLRPDISGTDRKGNPFDFFYRVFDANIDHIMDVARYRGKNDPQSYYREELRNYIAIVEEARKFYREHGWWSFFHD